MALMAGYVSKRGKLKAALLGRRTVSFVILPGEDATSYKDVVIETKFGHVIQKYKSDHPMPPVVQTDDEGNVLAVLGFMCMHDSVSSYQRLLAACVVDARAVEQCAGEFVAIFVDGSSGAVHIINDRFAARPFYVIDCAAATYFSSNLAFLLHLAETRSGVDVVGCLQVFTCGHTVGTRTTIEGVARLRPATHLSVVPERIVEKQYWRLIHTPREDLDPVEHGVAVFEAFRSGAAVRARLARRGVVPLSGGLDSRLVAGSLPDRSNYSGFTFVDSPVMKSTLETQAAAEVCRALGLTHHVRAVPAGAYGRHARDVIALTGGLRPLHHMAIAMSYVEEMKRVGSMFLLGGGPGDVLAGSYIPSTDYLDPLRVQECIAHFCRRRAALGAHLGLLLRDDVLASNRQVIYRSLLESFQPLGGPTAAHRVTAWAMVYRQPAFTFTSLMHCHPDVSEAFCHLDYSYCDLMLQLPAEWLYERNFYSLMIYNNLPQLRHIVYSNTNMPLSGRLMTVNYRQPRLTVLGKRIGDQLASVRRRTARLITRSRGAPGLHQSLMRHDQQLLAEVTECLHSCERLSEFLDIRKCDQFLAGFKSGTYQAQAHQELFGSLATMCLSHRDLRL
jgi:hypothetical protein